MTGEHIYIEPPTLHTERLILEPLSAEHIPTYQEHFANYEVIRHLSAHVPWPYPEDGVETYVLDRVLPSQGRTRWDWAICLKEAPGVAVGSIGLWIPGAPESRGFWLAEHLWGQGLMTEATRPVNDFWFDVLGFDTLILANARGNERSGRIKASSGAVKIDLIEFAFVDPTYTQSDVWELTREAWRENQRG